MIGVGAFFPLSKKNKIDLPFLSSYNQQNTFFDRTVQHPFWIDRGLSIIVSYLVLIAFLHVWCQHSVVAWLSHFTGYAKPYNKSDQVKVM